MTQKVFRKYDKIYEKYLDRLEKLKVQQKIAITNSVQNSPRKADYNSELKK